LRFAKPADLELLLPVFWIGFSLFLLATSRMTVRYVIRPVASGTAA
jgi:hypothetical protein